MSELLKIKCDSTYLDKAHPKNNYYSDEKLLVGIINKNSPVKNEFRSVLKFDISDIYCNSIDSAFLFLFVENLKSVPNLGNSISISGFTEDIYLEDINWQDTSEYILTPKVNSFISPLYINKYIKIDISSIIKSLPKNINTCNLLIEHTPITHNSIIKFSKSSSKFPAYITLDANFENDSVKDNDYSFNDNSNILEENNEANTPYNEILDTIDIQSDKINSIDNAILEINSKISILSDSMSLISNKLLNTSEDTISVKLNNINKSLELIKENIPKSSDSNCYDSIITKINELLDFAENNPNIDFLNLNSNLTQLAFNIEKLNDTLPDIKNLILILIDIFKDSSITTLKNQ